MGLQLQVVKVWGFGVNTLKFRAHETELGLVETEIGVVGFDFMVVAWTCLSQVGRF